MGFIESLKKALGLEKEEQAPAAPVQEAPKPEIKTEEQNLNIQ